MLPTTTTTTPTTSKDSTCFICSQEFPLSELTAHEKTCLENIKSNDIAYTRQYNDDSSTGSFPLAYASNLSTHTSSSGESGGDKKYSRCYICGTDVPSYLSSIHEKNCKKSWETGLLNSICTPARKSSSRGDLSKENSLSTPNLRKAQSSTTLQVNDKTSDDAKNKQSIKSKRVNNNSNSPSRSNSTKSKSTNNLSATPTKSHRTLSANSASNLYSATTKSPEELRKSTEKLKMIDNPQYMICQTCGKLYSVHSISIHQRQCERTYSLQKKVGTNVEYKVKSKSLADLTHNSRNPRRPQTALNTRPTTPKTSSQKTTTPRPASANPINRKHTGTSLSSSTGNLTSSTPTYKRQLLKTLKNNTADGGGSEPPSNTTLTPENSKSSTGLQKCYLCKQLYGTRSLPIHEKQCLKKWERNQEEEKQSKKPPVQKEIQILAFGHSRFDDESTVESANASSNQQRKSSVTPSQMFGIPSPLKKDESKNNSKTLGNEISKELSIDYDPNSSVHSNDQFEKHTTEPGHTSQNSHTLRPGSASKTGNSKFVVCIYCYKQYGLHSIAIHEKNCRERKNVEAEYKERIANNSKNKMTNIPLSKSVGNISSVSSAANHAYANGDAIDLVKCDECQRKFLSSDIDKHKRFCRVSVV